MNFKIYDNHSCCFQWMYHLIFHIERRTQAEGAQEQGSKDNIWAKEIGRGECRRNYIKMDFMTCTSLEMYSGSKLKEHKYVWNVACVGRR